MSANNKNTQNARSNIDRRVDWTITTVTNNAEQYKEEIKIKNLEHTEH